MKMILPLSENRLFLMGCAISMVLCFHICGRYNIYPLDLITAKGYYGVDIFLFLSAYGLCFSLEKNSLSVFYKNRACRILPTFFLLASFQVVFFALEKNVNLAEIIVSILGLGYFKFLGGCKVDWYLSALIILYIFFPLIYRFVKNFQEKALIAIALTSIFVCLGFPLYWEHQCLIGRLPIFFLGVYTFLFRNEEKIKKTFLLFIITGSFFIIIEQFVLYWRFRFLTPAFFTPSIILSLLFIKKKLQVKVGVFHFLGKHTLEIYVANCMTSKLVPLLSDDKFGKAIYDIFLTVTITFFLFLFQHFVSQSLRK